MLRKACPHIAVIDNDYNYDGNGNMVQDKNRGIADGSIRYNILNLSKEVVINGITMQYHYDATGSKDAAQYGQR